MSQKSFCQRTQALDSAAVLVIAHRGASKAAKENTVEAFRLARQMGSDMVELDVRRSGSGSLVIHHDAHVPDGRAINETLDADLPVDMPTLSQAMAACDGMIVNIEIKNDVEDPDFDTTDSVAGDVVAYLQATDQRQRVVISSFRLETIDRVRELDPSIPTAWLVTFVEDPAATIATLTDHGHVIFHPHWTACTPALFDITHAAGVAVNCWTCDQPDVMAQLLGLGINGICTNVPDVLVGVLQNL